MGKDKYLESIWHAVDSLRGYVPIDDVPVVLGTAIVLEHAFATNAKAPESIIGAATSVLGDQSEATLTRLRADLASGTGNETDRLELWRTYIEYTSDKQGMAGEFTSSRSAIDLAVSALTRSLRDMPESPIVWDPCSGSGLLAVSVAMRLREKGLDPQVILWDLNPRAVHSSSVFAFLADMPATTQQRDALLWDPELEPIHANMVVADPPMGLDWNRQAQSVSDLQSANAYPWGLPRKSDGTWLFLQQLTAGMGKQSRALMFASMGPLWSSDSNAIRRHLVDSGLLRAIAYLPAGTAANTAIERSALLLDNSRPASQRERVTLVNLRDLFRSASPGSRQPRALLPEATQELDRALANPKPTRISRTVRTSDFEYQRVEVSFDQFAKHESATVSHKIPLSADLDEWMNRRYGRLTSMEVRQSKTGLIELGGSQVFVGRVSSSLDRNHVRLSSLTSALRIPPSRHSRVAVCGFAGPATVAAWIVVRRRAITVEPSLPATEAPGEDDLDAEGAWQFAFQLQDGLDPAFVARYLGGRLTAPSPGRVGPTTASVTNARQAMAVLDEVVVPWPSSEEQQRILAALDKLELVSLQHESDLREIWSGAVPPSDVHSRADSYLGHEDLPSRLRRWPNPIASAAWIVETSGSVPESQEKALVRFWEAVSGFHATVLLSAIKGIPDLETPTLTTIRDGITQAGQLNLAEASFGSFSLITSAAAKHIRSHINRVENTSGRATGSEGESVNAELDQVISAFGGLGLDLVQQLVSGDLVALFDRLRPLRTPGAHGGNETRAQLAHRVQAMRELMLEWDALTKRVWSDYVLVRGGLAERLDDSYRQELEYILGNDYPFLRNNVQTLDVMKSGRLYMFTPSAGDFMEIRAPLFEFVEVPEEAHFACYYFNRLRGGNIDLKSFVYPKELQGSDIAPEIGSTIHWLMGDVPAAR